jgi:type II secretory pathway pseudopilin PulG
MTGKFHYQQQGATLLEVLLGMAIAGAILVLGIRLTQSLQNTQQLEQLRYNIDQLFQAASNYYKANCASGDFSPTPPDVLSPYPRSTSTGISYPPALTSYFRIPVVGKLIGDGYLTNWSPANPMVDNTGGESGYIVQLNPIVLNTISANACEVVRKGIRCVKTTPTSTIPTNQATIVTWTIQVAVKVKPASKARAYAAVLGADCVSGESVGSVPTTVDACPSANPAANYLVWKRTPSATTLKNASVLNATLPQLQQFNLQYTHDVNYELNSGYSTTTSPSQAPVYYLCGG